MVVQWLNSVITLWSWENTSSYITVISAQNTTYVPYHIVCVSLLNDLSNTYQISCILRQPQASYLSKSSSRTSSAHLFASMPAILLTAKNSRRHRSIQASERSRSEPNDISGFHWKWVNGDHFYTVREFDIWFNSL